MKKLICLIVCGAYLFTSSVALAFEAECINPDGKFTDCTAEINDGQLTVQYDSKKWQKLDKTIPGNHITALTGGEYARRRVGESIGAAALLGPLFLFMLFSKKKRDNFGVEYVTANGNKDAVLIQLKKKYGFAFGQQLKTISGLDIQMEGKDTGKDKQEPATTAAQKDSTEMVKAVSSQPTDTAAAEAMVSASNANSEGAAVADATENQASEKDDVAPAVAVKAKRKHR